MGRLARRPEGQFNRIGVALRTDCVTVSQPVTSSDLTDSALGNSVKARISIAIAVATAVARAIALTMDYKNTQYCYQIARSERTLWR